MDSNLNQNADSMCWFERMEGKFKQRRKAEILFDTRLTRHEEAYFQESINQTVTLIILIFCSANTET